MNAYPALKLWRRELTAGHRNRRTCDALWTAACREASAQECEKLGLWGAWSHHIRRAHETIGKAAKEKRGAA